MNLADPHCRFFKTPAGVKVQELAKGSGPEAKPGDRLEVDYVLRRTNGYFIYSTREGVSFQPKDIPTGPYELKLVMISSQILRTDAFSCLFG